MATTGSSPIGLTSIVITCRNQLALTRLCISALVRHTRPPWELIAIDNGSTDCTAIYLAGVQDGASSPVTIIANSKGQTPSDACRQGLKVARGAYLVVLDSDAVVTDGWLDQLIALAESDSNVGMTGSMSNEASPPQRVDSTPYGDRAALDRFAARWRNDHRGQWLTVAAITGPCVLIKRRVLEAVGFPKVTDGSDLLGTDLPRRLRENGFTARVAHDLFIHQGEFRSPSPPSRTITPVAQLDAADFTRRFGESNLTRALCGYTLAADTRIVLTLLIHTQACRVLEIGTAFGHMTANLTEWTGDQARIFTLGIVRGMEVAGTPEQGYEVPEPGDFGGKANYFGKADKVTFLTADSRDFDFGSLAPLDFVFIDGGHDLEHVTSDTTGAYAALAPGGYLVWHDFDSPVPWIQVREGIERLGLAETVTHVIGTEVAFLRKQGPGFEPHATPLRSEPLRLVWEGDQCGRHSLALTNRALCRALAALG